jgi:hypothetical protein
MCGASRVVIPHHHFHAISSHGAADHVFPASQFTAVEEGVQITSRREAKPRGG